jgi:hypothetical protein
MYSATDRKYQVLVTMLTGTSLFYQGLAKCRVIKPKLLGGDKATKRRK